MAKPELGVKRVCPETGRKFYDLNRDPIVSPYTGVAYPASAFEPITSKKLRAVADKAAERADADDDEEVAEDVDTISLEDADAETSSGKESADDDADDVDVDGDDDAEAFLEADEDSDDDVTEIIGDREKDEEA
ncbi:TIGR02300 family protein [Methylopila musalis]|uniref:TIGR02300 family protein n=1 Tax=Methylopila musalis TaxID=1134781 RepID=A0ABW3Z3T1_9HYPH